MRAPLLIRNWIVSGQVFGRAKKHVAGTIGERAGTSVSKKETGEFASPVAIYVITQGLPQCITTSDTVFRKQARQVSPNATGILEI